MCRALREAVLRQGTEEGKPVDDKKYKGMNNYIDYRAGFRGDISSIQIFCLVNGCAPERIAAGDVKSAKRVHKP
eukprot:1161455-Pelagomonas_calceolata.AAC.6